MRRPKSRKGADATTPLQEHGFSFRIDFRNMNGVLQSLRKEEFMGDVLHTIRSRVEKDAGVVRRAYIEDFPEPVRFGMHPGIKAIYGVETPEDLPATLDYIVTAVAS